MRRGFLDDVKAQLLGQYIFSLQTMWKGKINKRIFLTNYNNFKNNSEANWKSFPRMNRKQCDPWLAEWESVWVMCSSIERVSQSIKHWPVGCTKLDVDVLTKHKDVSHKDLSAVTTIPTATTELFRTRRVIMLTTKEYKVSLSSLITTLKDINFFYYN